MRGRSSAPRDAISTLTTAALIRAATLAKSTAGVTAEEADGWSDSTTSGRTCEPAGGIVPIPRDSGGRVPAATRPRRKLTRADRPISAPAWRVISRTPDRGPISLLGHYKGEESLLVEFLNAQGPGLVELAPAVSSHHEPCRLLAV